MTEPDSGSRPREMPAGQASVLDIRMIMQGLPIAAPDPLAVSLGGSETAGLQLAAELVRQGHRVTVACDTDTPFSWRGVELRRGFKAQEFAVPYDLLIVHRQPEGLRYRGAGKAAFLWLHHVPPPTGPEAVSLIENSVLADKVVYDSEFQAEAYHRSIPQMQIASALVIRDGPDLGPVARQIVEASRDVAGRAPRPIPEGATVMIGTPCFGGMVTVGYLDSMIGTVHHFQGIPADLVVHANAGESLITRGRSEIAAAFLARPEQSHLLFIDADVQWRAEDIVRLLAHDLPVVCGIYPVKRPGGHLAARPLGRWSDAPRDATTGCIEIEYAATGFLMIKRQVFDALAAAYPDSKISRTHEKSRWRLPWLYDFFATMIVDGELLSEDYSFSHRWRAIGGKVWADPTIKLTHWGQHGYTCDPAAPIA